MITAEAEAERLYPSSPLPTYTYYPGSGMPHPVRDPKGHSHGKKHAPGQGTQKSSPQPREGIFCSGSGTKVAGCS